MYEKIISKNINNLNKYITRGFFLTKDIYLTDEESLYVTNIIKNDWYDLLNKNYNKSFRELKEKVSLENYEKILSYYLSLKI